MLCESPDSLVPLCDHIGGDSGLQCRYSGDVECGDGTILHSPSRLRVPPNISSVHRPDGMALVRTIRRAARLRPWRCATPNKRCSAASGTAHAPTSRRPALKPQLWHSAPYALASAMTGDLLVGMLLVLGGA